MTLVHCHGTFDLLHPGHIDHLQQARALGDRLVVTITADRFVNKGPGRPVFTERDRLMALDALACVDEAYVNPHPDAASAIRSVRPDIYCKGKDYEGSQDPEFQNDLAACREVGAEVRYLGDVRHSSTQLLNRHAEHINPKVLEFAASLHLSPAEFKDAVESLAALRVLVIGDAIYDHYTFVEVQGLISKSRVLSSRYLRNETYPGGVMAIGNHIEQFASGAIGISGSEATVKRRYVESAATKLFSVNQLAPQISVKEEADISAQIRARLPETDVVVVGDFGHGMMTSHLRTLVQFESKFLALNCQTNSANHGFNIIDRQYHRADCFSLDETELTLSMGVREFDRGAALEALRRTLGAKQAWLTRGGTETIGTSMTDMWKDKWRPDSAICPPFATSVVDTVGAGDAFFAVAALGCAAGLPIGLTTFLGQLAGAQAVQIVGNSTPINKQTLLKSGMALLNQ